MTARDWWNNPKVGDVEKAERLLDAMEPFDHVTDHDESETT